MRVPDNWREFSSGSQVTFAPDGAYGDRGITHGALVGIVPSGSVDLQAATREHINELLRNNPYLRLRSGPIRTRVAGQIGYSAELAGRSDITGETEIVKIYTTRMQNGDLFYLAGVSPQDEEFRYDNAFRVMLNSIRLFR
jgi:hypothetical protein